jgi:hypothetical protein
MKNKQVPEPMQGTETQNLSQQYKGNKYFSILDSDFAEIYEAQNGWSDPMPPLRELAQHLKKGSIRT